jgi:hypothetical protein
VSSDVRVFEGVLSQVESVKVVAGSTFDARRRKNNVLMATEGEAAVIEELRTALRPQPGDEQYAFMTRGEPTLALFDADDHLLGTVTCLLPDFIRTDTLRGDTRLVDPGALGAWLAAHGWSAESDEDR